MFFKQKSLLEIGVSNPTDNDMTLQAFIDGAALTGFTAIKVPPKGREVYKVLYSPSVIGTSSGSVVFYNAIVGEFWYELSLVATKPEPTQLKTMECELGRCASLQYSLRNLRRVSGMLIIMTSQVHNTAGELGEPDG